MALPSIITAQEKNAMKYLLKNQWQYYNNHIPKNEKANYVSVLKMANIVRPKAIAYTKKVNPDFFDCDSINIVEGFQQTYSHLYGLIWTSDSVVYTYNFNCDKPIEQNIKKRA
jgi:hypothetical protein